MGELRGDGLERPVQLGKIGDHDEQLPQRQAPGLHAARADEENQGGAAGNRQVRGQDHDSFRHRKPDTRLHPFARTFGEARRLVLLSGKGLHEANRSKDLLQDP